MSRVLEGECACCETMAVVKVAAVVHADRSAASVHVIDQAVEVLREVLLSGETAGAILAISTRRYYALGRDVLSYENGR